MALEERLARVLEEHLPALIAPFGRRILIVGREVVLGPSLRADLLAIDENGCTYVIEIKGEELAPRATSQGLSYRRALRALSRTELIGIARDCAGINLERAFRLQFTKQLPPAINTRQTILVIGIALSDHTARAVAELREIEGTDIHAFRFDERPTSIGLVPCARDETDLVAATHRLPAEQPSCAKTIRRPYAPSLQVRQFWSWMSPRFASPIVKFASVYAKYTEWVATMAPQRADVTLLPLGTFSRQLHSVVLDDGHWELIYLRPEDDIDPNRIPLELPTTRRERDAVHRISGYRRSRAAHLSTGGTR